MQSVTLPGANGTDTTTFAYNALGERVVKNGIYGTTHFHYTSDGRLLAETDANGNVIREYIWLEQRPVALVAQPNAGGNVALYAVHTDQIDTALALTDSTQTVTWRYDRKPFGQLAAGGNTVRWPLRFPGQYEDWETGIFYNYFRDYDPQTGRYIESDPIGLEGGINTYAYVDGNPITYVDPTGEFGIVGGLIGAGIEIGMQGWRNHQNGCDPFDLDNYDGWDILVSAGIGAAAPGWVAVGKRANRARGAISTISKQSARTANRAAKNRMRIRVHKDEATMLLSTQVAWQFGKGMAQAQNPSPTRCGCGGN